jgi:hypothetical protein
VRLPWPLNRCLASSIGTWILGNETLRDDAAEHGPAIPLADKSLMEILQCGQATDTTLRDRRNTGVNSERNRRDKRASNELRSESLRRLPSREEQRLISQNDPNRTDHSASQIGDRTCIWRLLRLVEFAGVRPTNARSRRNRHGRPHFQADFQLLRINPDRPRCDDVGRAQRATETRLRGWAYRMICR